MLRALVSTKYPFLCTVADEYSSLFDFVVCGAWAVQVFMLRWISMEDMQSRLPSCRYGSANLKTAKRMRT